MAQLGGGQLLFEKPRYRHEVLVGNWLEDRALRDYNNSLENRPVTKLQEDKELKQNDTRDLSSSAQNTTRGGYRFPPKYDSGVQYPDFPAVSSGDALRGYYSTTYKRSYGPRPSYVHYSTAAYLTRKNMKESASPLQTMPVPSESDREIITIDRGQLLSGL